MSSRYSLSILVLVCFFIFSGFEKVPVIENFKREESLKVWLNETDSMSLKESFEKEGVAYGKFTAFSRESDYQKTLYGKTITPLDTTEEDIYIVLIDEKTYLKEKEADVKPLTEDYLKKIRELGRFTDSKSRRYQPKKLQKGIKTADQLILDGHVFGVMARPVSSSYRLMTWMGGTGKDVLLQDISRYFEDEEIPPLYEGEGMDVEAFEKRLDEMFGDHRANGTIDFLIGGREYFPRQLEAFKQAQKNIDVRIFIFDNDDYGVKIADVLREQSKEVDVRILLDGMGVVMGESETSASVPEEFKSPDSIIHYLKKDSSAKVRVRPNAWFKADHTKTIFIDEETVFTGGMNFGREYRYDWHDMMMELKGPIVQKLHREYEVAWSHAGKLGDLAYLRTIIKLKEKDSDFEGGFPIRPLYTRAGDQQIYKSQIEAIKAAKKYIYISNAYFSDNALIYELIRARRRGVDVRIVLPIHGNHEIMNKSNVIAANVLFDNGIKVYFYPGMSHIKAAIYDGWFCAGSANFDKLSFRDNVELNIATSDPETVEDIRERLFEADIKKSAPMKERIKTNLRNHFANFLAQQL